MHGENEICVQKFWIKNLKRRDHSENLVIDRRIKLELIKILKIQGQEDANWIHMAEGKDW
jgi:hypothetical protein